MPTHKVARIVAEEVLRTIYGDDLQGCSVTLEAMAGVVEEALRQNRGAAEELFDIYKGVVEAVHLLSTPPDPGNVTDPDKLRALLSERLDAIQVLTRKTIDMAAKINESSP